MFPAVKLVLVTVTRLGECHVAHVTRDTGLVTSNILPDLHDVRLHDGQSTLAALQVDIDCGWLDSELVTELLSFPDELPRLWPVTTGLTCWPLGTRGPITGQPGLITLPPAVPAPSLCSPHLWSLSVFSSDSPRPWRPALGSQRPTSARCEAQEKLCFSWDPRLCLCRFMQHHQIVSLYLPLYRNKLKNSRGCRNPR